MYSVKMERLAWRGPDHLNRARYSAIVDGMGQNFLDAKQTAVQIAVFTGATVFLAGSLLTKNRPKKVDAEKLRQELDALAIAGRNEPHHRGNVETPHAHSRQTGGRSWGRGRPQGS